jgi:hypothetical protein
VGLPVTVRALPCPRCAHGVVRVTVATWPDARAPGGARRSAWADEPVCCSGGCALGTDALVPLLRGAHKERVWQATLWDETGVGG